MKRLLKQAGSALALSGWTFATLQKLGLSIVRTKESPIPDVRLLNAEQDHWERESELVGVDLNVAKQLAVLNQVFPLYREEWDFLRTKGGVPYEFCVYNDSFGLISAIVLHCMIRHFKPRTILEVGAGNSTFVSARASLMNREGGHETNLIAIEPYPRDAVIRQGFPGLGQLIEKRVETVGLPPFTALDGNDILFIDGSHYVKTGGDVGFLFLEVLPRLKRGVLVHVHDIFFPFEYPRKWILEDRTFYNEQYLLQAFLCYNHAFEILWAERYMKAKHSEECESVFPGMLGTQENHQSNSFWMRKVA